MPTNNFFTKCVHSGEIEDKQFKGAVSPIFMATSYAYFDVETLRYPRYFNTPNQEVIGKKIADLEGAEAGLPFASGMAAISNTLFAFLKKGDHIVLQKDIYGGAFHFAEEEFEKYGIQYSFTKGIDVNDFRKEIKKNTKILYFETPSNPLLKIVDVKAVASLAKEYQLISIVDNTFASPINQNPIKMGVDIVIHSATKYLGGHSDILAGVVVSNKEYIRQIFQTGKNFGGNLSHFISYLLERSIKTLAVRVKKHNKNAKKVAKFLEKHPKVTKVFYPGLKSHSNHQIAKKQMNGFGGMLSFELKKGIDPKVFQKKLKLIKPSLSLAGVESTILQPAETSHKLIGSEKRKEQGITDELLRLSVGIENATNIINDLNQALK
ncbi:MAG TPA: PLP-dependent transferase [Flavobacteriia bacterium]|nr:PLP-dependent transferase [Flavobacteriia bacterium]